MQDFFFFFFLSLTTETVRKLQKERNQQHNSCPDLHRKAVFESFFLIVIIRSESGNCSRRWNLFLWDSVGQTIIIQAEEKSANFVYNRKTNIFTVFNGCNVILILSVNILRFCFKLFATSGLARFTGCCAFERGVSHQVNLPNLVVWAAQNTSVYNFN